MMEMRVMMEMVNLSCEKLHRFYKLHILQKILQAGRFQVSITCEFSCTFFPFRKQL
jgi:hypothetical protein